MSEPVAKTMLLCNFVLQDDCKRWTYVAVFDRFWFKSFPAVADDFYICSRLVDLPPKGAVLIQIEDPKGMVIWTSGPQLFEMTGDPGMGLDGSVHVRSCLFAVKGKYRASLFINSDLVAGTDFTVAERNPVADPLAG